MKRKVGWGCVFAFTSVSSLHPAEHQHGAGAADPQPRLGGEIAEMTCTLRICCCSVLTPYSPDPPLLRCSPGVCARSAARRSMSSSEEDPTRPEGSDGNTREKLTRQSPPVQCQGVPRPPTGRGEMALRSQETSPAGGRRHQGLEDPDEQEGGWPGQDTRRAQLWAWRELCDPQWDTKAAA